MKRLFLLLAIFCLCKDELLNSQEPCGFFTQVPASPFVTGSGPSSVAFSPLIGMNKLLSAVTNLNNNSISVYDVNLATGTFSPVTGSVVTTISPYTVAFSPLIDNDTLFAAITNFSINTLTAYSVNLTTGVFTQINPPVNTQNNPIYIAFSPLINGSTLYTAVANSGSNSISVYSVTSTGVFTHLSDYPVGDEPESIAFSPLIGGNTLYAAVANTRSNNISVYTVNTSTGPNAGEFTQVTGSPFPSGSGPSVVAFSPLIGTDILYAAVTNVFASSASIYSVNTGNGKFTQVTSSPLPLIAEPTSLAFSPLIGGSTVLAAITNSANSVAVYDVNTSTGPNAGEFTQVTGSPFATQNSPLSVSISPLIGTNTLFSAVANGGSKTVSVFDVVLLGVSVSPTIQVICTNGIIQLNATVTNGTPPYTYLWTGPNGFSATTPTVTIPNPTLADSGTYVLTVTDSTSCEGMSSPSTVVVKSVNGPCT